MELKYHDRKADTLYIRFNDSKYAYSNELDDFRFIDYDSDDNPIGVELLNVNNGVSLDGLPYQKAILHLINSSSIKER